MRVLVVDDDAASRELLDVALTRRGWEVATATDGEDALTRAREGEFDVCISDILMPRMDGYRLCREWRSDESLCDIPFVFYTATYTTKEDEEFALSLGADGFIVKPTDPDDFVSIVEPLVRLQASTAEHRQPCAGLPPENDVLRGYNERLVRKLEDKLMQVRRVNGELRDALEVLSDEVGVKHELIGRLDEELERSADIFDIRAVEVIPDLIDGAPVAIVIMDQEGLPARWNVAAEELLGLPESESATRERFGQMHPQSQAEYQGTVERMLAGETLHGVEMTAAQPGGGYRDMLFSGGPLRHADRIVGAMAIIDDITERRRAELELEDHRDRLEDLVDARTSELTQLNERLQDAARAKSSFLASMGHEMRNKLNSIIGFSGILQQGLVGEMSDEQRRQVDMIYTAGQALLALVNDVVDLSRIEAGQLELRVAPFELLGFLDGVVESFRAAADRRRIGLQLVAPAGALPMNSDQRKIEQVVRNLLSNGIKFTEFGEVRLEVEEADAGENVVIRVRDTGGGVSPEVMSRIFDEFVKQEQDETVGSQGTGLGLALTRRLCEMLGGSVSARSNPGEGSVFTVVIPVDISLADDLA